MQIQLNVMFEMLAIFLLFSILLLNVLMFLAEFDDDKRSRLCDVDRIFRCFFSKSPESLT